jgi:hypothetical protein
MNNCTLLVTIGLGLAMTACSDAGVAVEDVASEEQALTVTISFQDGAVLPDGTVYGNTEEATMDGDNPKAILGARAYCEVGGVRSAVLNWRKFQRHIPQEARITSAKIHLSTNGLASFAIAPLLKDWREPEVSWLEASYGVPWAGFGASIVYDDRGTRMGLFTFDASQLTVPITGSALQALQQRKSFYGFVLDRGQAGPFIFFSSEHPDISKRPRLEITYTL